MKIMDYNLSGLKQVLYSFTVPEASSSPIARTQEDLAASEIQGGICYCLFLASGDDHSFLAFLDCSCITPISASVASLLSPYVFTLCFALLRMT